MIKRFPELIEHLPKGLRIIILTLVERLDSGKNCLVALVGQTGGGKSFAGVSLLYWIYIYMHGKKPTVEYMRNHWFFKGKDFLKRMNDPTLTKKEGNLWDEMGTSASHKTHQSLQNKAIGWLVQTFRNLEQLVIFTVPTTAFIDASVRKLLHYQFETRTILKTEKVCIIKQLILQYNMRMDKMFYHNFTYPSNDGSGLIDEVDVIGVPIPPKEFVEAYEEMSWKFKSELNQQIQKMLEKAEERDSINTLSGDDLIMFNATPNQKMVLNYYKQGITSTTEIARLEGMGKSNVSQYIRTLRDNGLDIYKIRKQGLENLKKNAPPQFNS